MRRIGITTRYADVDGGYAAIRKVNGGRFRRASVKKACKLDLYCLGLGSGEEVMFHCRVCDAADVLVVPCRAGDKHDRSLPQFDRNVARQAEVRGIGRR